MTRNGATKINKRRDRMLIVCSACGSKVGHYIQVNSETWLQIGGVKVSSMHGQCATCGNDFHFRASMKNINIVTDFKEVIEP